MTTPRVAREQWEHQYTAGRWDYLDGDEERDRHVVLASRVCSRRARTVLDLGCGTGALFRELLALGFDGEYLGIDWSETSVSRAAKRLGGRFVCADVATLPVVGTYDVVVLSEVLYYLDDPARTLHRLVPLVEADGSILVTVYQPGAGRSSSWHGVVRELDRMLSDVGAWRETVRSESQPDQTWFVYGLAPERAADVRASPRGDER